MNTAAKHRIFRASYAASHRPLACVRLSHLVAETVSQRAIHRAVRENRVDVSAPPLVKPKRVHASGGTMGSILVLVETPAHNTNHAKARLLNEGM